MAPKQDAGGNFSHAFLTVLSLPATAMGFALSVQIAALSWIMSEVYGLDIHEVGLVWAAGPIAGILGQPIVGAISDNVWFWGGRRKPFIWIGGVLTALALLALPNIGGIASFLGLEQILGVAILVTLVLDLSINISFNPTRSIIADVTPDDHRRTRAYTWMQVVSGSFGVLAYLIGITMGNYVLIYLGAILVLLFSMLPPLFIKEPRVLGEHGGDAEAAEAGVGEAAEAESAAADDAPPAKTPLPKRPRLPLGRLLPPCCLWAVFLCMPSISLVRRLGVVQPGEVMEGPMKPRTTRQSMRRPVVLELSPWSGLPSG
jgi:hypothetical protein